MPNLTIEYSANLTNFDAEKTLETVNTAIAALTQHFKEMDIKSRVIRHEHFRIGTKDEPRAFIHAQLSILSGRSKEIKKEISQTLLQALRQSYMASPGNLAVQFCSEILDNDRDSYLKETIML